MDKTLTELKKAGNNPVVLPPGPISPYLLFQQHMNDDDLGAAPNVHHSAEGLMQGYINMCDKVTERLRDELSKVDESKPKSCWACGRTDDHYCVR